MRPCRQQVFIELCTPAFFKHDTPFRLGSCSKPQETTYLLKITMISMTTCIAAIGLLAAVDAALTPDNLVAPSISGALSALKYSHVGGQGTYNQVTKMIMGEGLSCPANPSCVTTPKEVSGNLAPFNEELTFALRGPFDVFNIAVYQPGNASAATWKRTSSWAVGSQPENLVFMNNKGGDKSGEWDACNGNSQSYANGDWTDATTAPNQETYTGHLSGTNEVNIVTATQCKDVPCDGFSRGTASHGWADSKLFVVDFDMPSNGTQNMPAIWALNSQVTNSAQYGCNCRGMGGDGGCGELDILEMLPSNTKQGITELYSFKGATGSGDGDFFPRPDGGRATYMVIFDMQTDQIVIQRLESWDYSQTQVPRSMIDGYLGAQAKLVSFATNARRAERRRPFMRAHREYHH
ncbi:unnamed protein product [Somion occarium]|uniref:glucan endo-1,3-beta-D-glucosidase n=1 Tax=Somion occarium TaxID=3059160 RepID=A0ABP1DWV3_9APHY